MEDDNIIQVPITKIKLPNGNFETLEVDPSVFSNEVYQEIFAKGLEVYINSRMAKVGAVTKLVGKDLVDAQAKARTIAKENLADLQAGKTKHTRGKAKSTIPAAERAEAMRLAKTAIKDWVRAAGFKPSHFNEKAYTAKAKEYVENDPSFLAQAKENIEARKTPSFKIDLNISDLGPAVKKTAKPKKDELPAGILGQKPSVQTTHRTH